MRTQGIKGELSLGVQQSTDEVSYSGSRRKYEQLFMTEELNLQTKGDVFDRKLLGFALGVGIGLRQQEYDFGQGSEKLSGDFSQYNLLMNLLSDKAYPTSVSLGKSESLMERRFNSPLQVETTTEGLHTRLDIPGWPMSISWQNQEVKQDSSFGSGTGDYIRTSERFNYAVDHDFSERSRLSFRSDLNDIKSKSGDYSYETETASHRLRHDYSFGNDDQHSLDTMLTYTEREGRFKSEVFDWTENLLLRHSDDFSTFYNTYFVGSEFAGVKGRTMSGSAGFMHSLYDNFRTNFSLNASKSESDFGSETTSYGGNIGFSYYRNNRWGRLRSRYSTSVISRETKAQTGTEAIVGESHTFTDPFPIELDRRNVVISSIVVTNNAGDEIYSLDSGSGGDYTVREVGDRVELDINPLDGDDPDIVNGQTLLVDYLVSVDGSWEEEYFRQSFFIEQAFKNGVSIFYNYDSHNSDINNDYGASTQDREYESNRVGIQYNGKRITLRAEHTESETNVNSTESDVLSARVHWPLTPRTMVDGHISQAWLDTTGIQPRDTSLFRAGVGVKSRLTRYLKLRGEVDLRKEDSSDRGRTEGLEFDLGLEYHRRQLSIGTGWRTYYLDYYNREREGSMFYLRVVRRF